MLLTVARAPQPQADHHRAGTAAVPAGDRDQEARLDRIALGELRIRDHDLELAELRLVEPVHRRLSTLTETARGRNRILVTDRRPRAGPRSGRRPSRRGSICRRPSVVSALAPRAACR